MSARAAGNRAAAAMAIVVALALVISLALAGATAGEDGKTSKPTKTTTPAPASTPATSATPKAPAADGKLPFHASKGDTLSADDENAVKGVLFDYLNSLKSHDFKRAGGHIDPESFLALADTMVHEAAGDTLPVDAVRQMLFGVASKEELRKRPVDELFATLMTASEASNPGAFSAVADAQIDVLAVRKVDDHVVIAYQLTIPGAGPEAQPVTHVTAESMRATGHGWKIVFRR